MKRIEQKSQRCSYNPGFFEAGLVKNSPHKKNNIYLKIVGQEKQHEKFDFTIDEAAAIISVLGCAIMEYTHDKRDLLKP